MRRSGGEEARGARKEAEKGMTMAIDADSSFDFQAFMEAPAAKENGNLLENTVSPSAWNPRYPQPGISRPLPI